MRWCCCDKKAVLFCWVKIIDMLLVTLLLMYNYILFYFLDLVKFLNKETFFLNEKNNNNKKIAPFYYASTDTH